MKQAKGSHDCVAAVAAMATSTTIEKFKEFFGQKDAYSDWEAYIYFMLHGYTLGVGVNIENGVDPNKVVFRIDLDIIQFPAYIVVESETIEGATHAIYWDGEIHDPNPDSPDGRSFSSYKIKKIMPISKVKDFTNCERNKIISLATCLYHGEVGG